MCFTISVELRQNYAINKFEARCFLFVLYVCDLFVISLRGAGRPPLRLSKPLGLTGPSCGVFNVWGNDRSGENAEAVKAAHRVDVAA